MSESTLANKEAPHICPHKFSFMLDNWLRRLIQNPDKILGPYINRGDTAIDMGCGPGFFTIDMAKLVGDTGRVVAVDLQQEMLMQVKVKATKHILEDRVDYHQCRQDRIGLSRRADFILAFYMVHETPSPGNFFKECKAILKEDGKLLVVEPRFHVSRRDFEAQVAEGEAAGLTIDGFPRKKGGRAVLFNA